MLGDRWIIDRVPTERFPDYTRGNAAEVLAEASVVLFEAALGGRDNDAPGRR